MDRKGVIGVVVCIVLYFVLNITLSRMFPPVHRAPGAAGSARSAATAVPTLSAAVPATNSAGLSNPGTATAAPTEAPAPTGEPAKLNLLENGDIRVTLTTKGAAIQSIELKQHHQGEKNIVLNEGSPTSVMAVAGWPGSESTAFAVAATPGSVTYTATMQNGLTWKRVYKLEKQFTIAVQDTVANTGASEAVLPAYSLSIGKAQPLLVKNQYQPSSSQYVGAGWLTTSKFHLTTVSAFAPSGIFTTTPGRDVISSTSIDPNPLRWLAVENQFFAVLVTPDVHHPITQATFTCTNTRDANGKISNNDEPQIEAAADFPELHLPAGQQTTIGYTVYAGPKEYDRLNALGDNQGELMNYDGFLPFSVIIVPMLWVLHTFNSWFHSYGVAIIMLTLVIKGITWPLQSIANRSGKRMQALQPKIKELQAKYKEQPEKLNTETFALYRDFGVNPFGGCLPAFVQMPVFFSLYYMLQNAVELRGRHFLWVRDLTQPDTIFTTALPFSFMGISHFTINPLPVMVTALMMVMMRMTPQMGDPQQQKIAQFMPLFFLFIFYNFAAALSLYYVINNSVAIIQIYRNLRKPLPDLKKKVKATVPAR